MRPASRAGMNLFLVRGLALALTLVGASGGERACLDAVQSGASYDVEVVAPYVQGGDYTFAVNGDSYFMSSGSCASTDGIGAGATLRFKGVGTVSNSSKTCELVTAQAVSLPAPITANGVSTDPDVLRQARASNGFMYAVEDATIGTCSGTLLFGFYSGGDPKGVFATPTAGKYPPLVLYRLFLPVTTGCQPCDDNFVARLVKE